MKLVIQSPAITPQESLLEFVNKKIGKLEQYSDRIKEARVTLRLDKSDSRENKICEVKLAIPGNDLFASRQSASFEAAILEVGEALRKQLISWKERQ